MPDLATLQERQQTLIRKALNGSAWLGSVTATAPTTLTTGTNADPVPLPAGYTDAGYLTKDDGLAFSRNVETSETTSWGASEPTRIDVTSDVDTVKWTMQETKRLSLELYHNVDLSAVTPTAQTGEIAFNKTSAPVTRYWRFMAITQDGAGADAIYIGRFHPRLSITNYEDLNWTDGQEIRYGVTGTAYVDNALGYSTRFYFGGPGWKALLEDMGFPAAA